MTVVVFLSSLFGFMAFGMPIAFALILTGAVLMWYLDFWDVQLLAQNLQAGADSFPLLAVPFFILAGELMNAGGISRRIINMAQAYFGHKRGGLGYVAIAASVLLASMSGSALADTAALATLLLPMMRERGYPLSSSSGLVAAGGGGGGAGCDCGGGLGQPLAVHACRARRVLPQPLSHARPAHSVCRCPLPRPSPLCSPRL